MIKIFAWVAVSVVSMALMPRPLSAAEAQTAPDIKPLPSIKIVLAGDSTVAPGGGWGAEFAKLLKTEAQCLNLASPGRSSKSFRDEGRWKKVLDQKPDYIFIQFGHNDMPGKGPERETDPNTTYAQNLKRYVEEARAIGAKPILVTPLTRRLFGPDGQIKSNLIPYALAVVQVAKDNHVTLVDLHARSIEQLNAIGRVAAKKYDRLGDDPTKPDKTHLSEAGEQETALLVASEVKNVEPELGDYVNLPVPPPQPQGQ